MASPDDPLGLGGLEPDAVKARVLENSNKSTPEQLQLQKQKEQRLADKEKRLNAVKAASAAPLPVNTKTTEERKEPLDIPLTLDKIYAYRERFSHIKSRNKVGPKSTAEEVLDELHYIELQLGSQGGQQAGLAPTALYCSLVCLERSTQYFNPLGLDLTGLGQVAQNNMADFQPLLDELMIKYQCGSYTSPETRLVLMIGAMAVTVNAANKNPATAKALAAMASGVTVPPNTGDL